MNGCVLHHSLDGGETWVEIEGETLLDSDPRWGDHEWTVAAQQRLC